jgi:hypothetical protein
MKTSIVKLMAAFVMVATMVGCASTGSGPELHSNDVVYDGPFQIG